MRRPIVILAVLTACLVACDNRSGEDLESQNRALRAELEQREKFIEEVTGSLLEIRERLDAVWAEERKILRKSETTEGMKSVSPVEIKESTLKRIADINSVLASNRRELNRLEKRLADSRLEYTSLEKMVAGLRDQLEERAQAITELKNQVMNLEQEVSEKAEIIAVRDQTIAHQARLLNKVLYIEGTRSELEEKGIIADEGGFLWGLIGSTTVLAPDFPSEEFVPLNRGTDMVIEVSGEIDELVPRRDPSSYELVRSETGRTSIRILDPEQFWKQGHMVIISSPTIPVQAGTS